ncbi:MAG: 3-dehydroquinate synthase [bacterium]
MKEEIIVNLGSRSYPVIVGSETIKVLGEYLRKKDCKYLAMIVDGRVETLWGERVREILDRARINYLFLKVKPGERSKNLTTARRLWDELADNKVDRGWWSASFGGGMVGDLAGFVFASYMRGLNFVQIPTTLLAQVDASIGGKVAIDHPKGKNLLGFFYQPKFVLIDVSFLSTLSTRQFKNGMAEVIKYGAIKDKALLQLLEAKEKDVKRKDKEVMEEIVKRCVRIKAEYVERDEKDVLGLRAQLNFGHTLGHILERKSDYRLLHGEAISIGMVFAGELSRRMGFLSPEELSFLKFLLSLYGLPLSIPFPLKKEEIIEGLAWDKKVKEGRIRFVLLKGLGEAFLCEDVPFNLVEEVALKLGAID